MKQTPVSESGFTFVEVLVAIAVISLVALAIGQGVFIAFRSFNAVSSVSRQNLVFLRLNDTLRFWCIKVHQPYYLPEIVHTVDENQTLHVYYLDNDYKKDLRINCQNQVFSIGDENTTQVFSGIENASFKLIQDKEKHLFGISITGTISKKDFSFFCRFGSRLVVQ